MNITGDKTIDGIIKVGLIGGIVWAGYKVFSQLLTNLQAPVGGNLPVPQRPGCNVNGIRAFMIRNNMDQIHEVHSGANIWNYPDKVNVILAYDQCELEFADNYFRQTYGQSLYANISAEWDVDGDYDAAELKLKQAGLAN